MAMQNEKNTKSLAELVTLATLVRDFLVCVTANHLTQDQHSMFMKLSDHLQVTTFPLIRELTDVKELESLEDRITRLERKWENMNNGGF